MFKTVIIDGKETELVANAATSVRYRQVFGRDLHQVFSDEQRAGEEGIDAVKELAFIMAKRAEGEDMNKLNFDMYLDWLEGFSAMAFIDAAEDILMVYMDSQKGMSTP